MNQGFAHGRGAARRTVAAPAKVNLHLDVLGRRADGFHTLETIFQTLELADEVTVALSPGADGIALTCDDPALPSDARNLAWRAVDAFRACRPVAGRCDVHLRKRIPAGAGMGGGSSDAAAVLRALAALVPDPPSAGELAAMAAQLGSDVPFFLTGGTAHALGRGEILTPLADLPRLALTVLKPPPPLPTPSVFAALTDAERGPREALGVAHFRERYAAGRVEPLHNRLSAPARRLEPQVDRLLDWLAQRGAPALLSGSGSACFILAHVDPPPGVRAWRTWMRPRSRLDAL
ncbi:MAG TPA: 4-(cytidine 5'-diphospho)-2-C-methyl-D-erythritol kinase [Planctomycetota bacterium]|nr:4-(cytidine 5'-diphospho)-2-C-methyl-D-erythritol kinase [Planctomycetota bacterium]